ncbi:MAG: choice-of-anchor D domain-containing protein, partial [Candidatus Kapabacteria bacterium]|nr:choice-of-anchor D domain-containing protein [Candidatus Kapabacteria bacterium]
MKSLLILCMLLCTQTLYSQSINLFDIDTTNFPTMKAKFFAFDAQRKQQYPNIGDMTLKENGELCTITNITCPPPKQRVLSVCIMVDTKYYIDIARLGTERLIGSLDMPQEDEVAVTYMEGRAAIWQDFTKDKDKALAKAQSIPLAPGVDVNTMFYSDYTGGIPMIKDRSSQKKVLILVSDLHCPNINIDESKVIADAKKYNISIYAVLLGTTDYTKLFSRIAAGTSGKVFENVKDAQQIENVFDKIAIAENNEPCNIEWQAQPACVHHKVIELAWQNQQSLNQYTVSLSMLSSLHASPSSIGFGSRALGTSHDTTITLTANNADFTVRGVNRKFGSADFTIVNTNFPFTIPQNESRTITLRYTASDSSVKYASFEITSNCPVFFSANAIFPRKNIITNTLKVIHPNGGEQFVAGSDSIITWTGISPTDTVHLDYSIDSGKIWKTITEKAVGLQYHWKNIPLPPSTQCLVRVRQLAMLSSFFSNDTIPIRSSDEQTYGVTSVAFSPDGVALALGIGDDYSVKLWNTITGKDIGTFKGHTKRVTSVAFSPDGTILASGSLDDTVKLWNPMTGQFLRSLSGLNGGVTSVAISPNGSPIISGSAHKSIMIWDINSGRPLDTLAPYDVTSVAFSPNGKTLAVGSKDKTIKLWDIVSGKEIRSFKEHSDYVSSVTFSPDGTTIASGSYDRTIKLWNVITGEEIRTFNGHTNYVTSVAFSPDGKTLASGSYDNTIKLWDVKKGSLLRNFSGHTYIVSSIAFSPDGSAIASGSYDRTAKIWEIESVLQEDQSDAVFSIIAPVAVLEKRNIDMGKVLVGSSKDTMVTAVLCNKGDAVLHVLGVDVTNGDRNEFIVPRGAGE